ncbi:sterile alpha motif domain-containing protein 13 isoform X1 [Falco rusticolus]|uniref:sterile alpha motif domain-containing protein 13 isoform X1 n=1 Tax=Falco rusticolus TaxID=120794 RepID=UPI000FFBD415|nr:sterile alpha motif domain-containing protein 13 isoform X1 [Falco rusticolus]XP_037260565.1 sterile alpha motif domain-containing protein 13 isoform X1 [Falco rusticolus]
MLTVDMENKENGSLDVKNSVENGRPPDPADWAVTDVVNYFRTAGFEEQANAFQEQVREVLLQLSLAGSSRVCAPFLVLSTACFFYEPGRGELLSWCVIWDGSSREHDKLQLNAAESLQVSNKTP